MTELFVTLCDTVLLTCVRVCVCGGWVGGWGLGWVWGVGCEVGVLFTCQTVVSKSMCNASLRMGLYVGGGGEAANRKSARKRAAFINVT